MRLNQKAGALDFITKLEYSESRNVVKVASWDAEAWFSNWDFAATMKNDEMHIEELLRILRQLLTRNQALGIEVIRRSVEPIDSIELEAIRFIGERGSVRMRALIDALGIAPSSATNLIDRLVSKKLVRRTSNDADRRIVQVSLDRHGKKVYGDALEGQLKLCREMLENFTSKERVGLIDLLGRLPGALNVDNKPSKEAKTKAS